MNVKLLGTGSAEGMPGLFCHCQTCARARAIGGKNIRTRSSALIDNVLKVDFPPDTHSQVVRNGIDLSSVNIVLFTHGHDDHFSPAELQYRGRYFVSEPPDCPLVVFGPNDVIDRLRADLDPELMSFSLEVMEPEKPAGIAGYWVFPFLANHDHSRVCLNYVIKNPTGAALLYASDTGWYSDRTWRLLEDFHFDAAVVECTKREEGGYPGHLSIPEVARMRRKLEECGSLKTDGPMIATHFGHQMEMLHEELDSVLSGQNILAGYDGISVDF